MAGGGEEPDVAVGGTAGEDLAKCSGCGKGGTKVVGAATPEPEMGERAMV